MGSIFVGAEAGPAAVADSTQTVAVIMAAAFVVAKVGLPKDRPEVAAADVPATACVQSH